MTKSEEMMSGENGEISMLQYHLGFHCSYP